MLNDGDVPPYYMASHHRRRGENTRGENMTEVASDQGAERYIWRDHSDEIHEDLTIQITAFCHVTPCTKKLN
jgi:hypothetical protein